LEHLGINEKEVEAPIRSSLEVVNIGETEDHIAVYVDKLAAASDHIVLINRIVVCDLTEGSEGNAVGVGIADIITHRLLDKIDMTALNINSVTGVCPEMGKIPLTLKNDREAIEIAIKCVGLIPRGRLKIMRIKNTSRLSEVDVSAAYEEELSNRKDLEIAIPKRAMVFDQEGNLETF
jgi:hypothetical protein